MSHSHCFVLSLYTYHIIALAKRWKILIFWLTNPLCWPPVLLKLTNNKHWNHPVVGLFAFTCRKHAQIYYKAPLYNVTTTSLCINTCWIIRIGQKKMLHNEDKYKVQVRYIKTMASLEQWQVFYIKIADMLTTIHQTNAKLKVLIETMAS
jgi:hypothetical protein